MNASISCTWAARPGPAPDATFAQFHPSGRAVVRAVRIVDRGAAKGESYDGAAL